MKSYTDLEQSKKLIEILPLESADMYYFRQIDNDYFPPNVESICPVPLFKDGKENFDYDIRCWSLAALLSVLPNGTDITKDKADTENEKYMCTVGVKDDIISTFGNNPVDACVDMILKLNELNLL